MDIGESLVAAYMRHVRRCEVVLTNVHFTHAQGEVDVVALDHTSGDQQVWLCEVSTHIRGMNSPTKRPAAKRVAEKVKRASDFAAEVFPQATAHFEIWSPRVRPGLATEIQTVVDSYAEKDIDVELVINDVYTRCIQELIYVARKTTSQVDDDAFRVLQILTHVNGTLTLQPETTKAP